MSQAGNYHGGRRQTVLSLFTVEVALRSRFEILSALGRASCQLAFHWESVRTAGESSALRTYYRFALSAGHQLGHRLHGVEYEHEFACRATARIEP